MKIENKTSKAKWFHYKIQGVPKQIFLGAYESYEEKEITDINQLKLNKRDDVLYKKEQNLGLNSFEDYSVGVYEKEILAEHFIKKTKLGRAYFFQMFDDGIGYSCGKHFNNFFAKTEDFGLSWKNINPNNESNTIEVMQFLNSQSGVCVSFEGNVYTTTDGCQTWSRISLPDEYIIDPTATSIHDSKFTMSIYIKSIDDIILSIRNGVSGIIIRTKDGGNTWNDVTPTGSANILIYNIDFINENIGWSVGFAGQIFKTEDGGDTWEQKGAGLTTKGLYAINIIDETKCWIAGSSQILMHTEDGGENWSVTTPSTLYNITYDYYVLPSNNNIHFAATSIGVKKSIDGGVTFNEIMSGIRNQDGMSISPVSEEKIYTASGDQSFFINRIDNLSANTLIFSAATYVTGGKVDDYFFQFGDDGFGEYTQDNGVTWIDYSNFESVQANISSCYPESINNIYVGGFYSSIRIQSAFTVHTEVSVPDIWYVRFVEKDKDEKLWIGGGYSSHQDSVFYSEDSGTTWVSAGLPAGTVCHSLYIVGDSMFIGANSGEMHYSHDKGNTWNIKKFETTLGNMHGYSIYSFDLNHIVIGSKFGHIFVSTDGGDNWSKSHSGYIYGYIIEFYYDNETKSLLAATAYGYILSSKDGGITWTVLYNLHIVIYGAKRFKNELFIFGGTGNVFSIKSGYVEKI